MQFDRPPMAHRIKIDRPYEPSFDTNIRRTFARERERLVRAAFEKEGYVLVEVCSKGDLRFGESFRRVTVPVERVLWPTLKPGAV